MRRQLKKDELDAELDAMIEKTVFCRRCDCVVCVCSTQASPERRIKIKDTVHVKMTIEMTEELAKIDGVECRIWTGHAFNGVPVRVYVHRVAVPLGEPLGVFDDCLLPRPHPATEETQNAP